MKLHHLFAFLLLAGLSACASQTRNTPALTAPPVQAAQPDPPKRGLLEQAGDTTWRVITAPALLIPSKKPTAQETPETYEAPTVTFVRRDEPGGPATLPPESAAPATQPAH